MEISYQTYSRYLFAKAEKRGIPLSGTFELTARCNLDCRMCYIHRRQNDAAALKEEKTADEWLELARSCRDEGMLLLLLTGGEPLLRPDFRKIYTGCRRLGLMVSINTNGTLLDEDMLHFLTNDPPARVNITLYGASSDTYAALCGDANAFQRAMDAIRGLKAAGIPTKINISVTPQNVQDVPKIYALAKELDIPFQAAAYMFPPVRACEQAACTSQRLTPEQAAQATIEYDRARFSTEQLHERWKQQLDGVAVPDPDAECQDIPREQIRCRAGSSTFWVTWNGHLRPCGMMTEPSRKIIPGGFTQAWEGIRQDRAKIFLPQECSECSMRHVCNRCPAICFAETGRFSGVPEYMCAYTKAYIDGIRREETHEA